MMMRMFLKPSRTLKPFNYITAAAMSSSSCSSGAKRCVHVICCGKEKPQDMDPKDFYIQTLTVVLGSEEAAKKAYISDIGGYRGFSAGNLTLEQADQISKQPGISLVYKDNKIIGLLGFQTIYVAAFTFMYVSQTSVMFCMNSKLSMLQPSLLCFMG